MGNTDFMEAVGDGVRAMPYGRASAADIAQVEMRLPQRGKSAIEHPGEKTDKLTRNPCNPGQDRTRSRPASEIYLLERSGRQQRNLPAEEHASRKRAVCPAIVNEQRLATLADIQNRASRAVFLGRPAAILVEDKLAFVGLSFREGEFQIAIQRARDDCVVRSVETIVEDDQQARRILELNAILELIVRVTEYFPDAFWSF